MQVTKIFEQTLSYLDFLRLDSSAGAGTIGAKISLKGIGGFWNPC